MRKLFTLKLSLLFLLSIVTVLKGRAQAIIAEEKGYVNGSYYSLENYVDPMMGDVNYQSVGQTFLATSTSPLGTIQFYLARLDNTATLNIDIYACSSANAWGSLLNTKTNVTVSAAGWVTVDVSALHISLTNGNYYGIRLMPQSGFSGGIGMNNNLYAGGQSWVGFDSGGSGMFFAGTDFPFSVAASSSLPVTLNSFTAQKQNNHALLEWSTATEQSSKSFTVQHSTDGNSWNDITSLPAAGNSNTIRHYSYMHANPAAGNNYYRLQQTDIDGKTNYSDVKVVKFTGTEAGFTVLVNPVGNGVLRVQINYTRSLVLYSPDGRLIWKKQFEPGLQSINMSSYGTGVFLLEGGGTAEKVVVL